MKVLVFILVSFFTVVSCSTQSSYYEKISKNLASQGQTYFDTLVSSGEYEKILTSIESGDTELINFSKKLIQYTDASTTTGLRFSLSRALPKNPLAVLSLIPDSFDVTSICTIPYIEESIEKELEHIELSINSLNGISNKNGIICLNIYIDIKKNITNASKLTTIPLLRNSIVSV